MDSTVRTDEEVYDHVSRIISHLRPYILGDGGDIELVGIEDGVVKVSLLGACAGCSLINITLDNGIKNWKSLKKAWPAASPRRKKSPVKSTLIS